MAAQQNDTIGSVNKYIADLADEFPGTAATIVKFSDHDTVLAASRPIRDVTGLHRHNYNPRGSTALLDAVASAIHATEAGMRDGDRALLVVVTDGEENASRKYTLPAIRDMIRERTKRGNWTFTFLGKDIDAWQSGQGLGIAGGNIGNFTGLTVKQAMGANYVGTRRFFQGATANTADLYRGTQVEVNPT